MIERHSFIEMIAICSLVIAPEMDTNREIETAIEREHNKLWF